MVLCSALETKKWSVGRGNGFTRKGPCKSVSRPTDHFLVLRAEVSSTYVDRSSVDVRATYLCWVNLDYVHPQPCHANVPKTFIPDIGQAASVHCSLFSQLSFRMASCQVRKSYPQLLKMQARELEPEILYFADRSHHGVTWNAFHTVSTDSSRSPVDVIGDPSLSRVIVSNCSNCALFRSEREPRGSCTCVRLSIPCFLLSLTLINFTSD